jgi:hypothetical protein
MPAKIYPEITETVLLQHIEDITKQKHIIDSIGIEYFFDGKYTDIGLRINTISNDDSDKDDDIYYQLLEHPLVSSDFDCLYNHYVKDFMIEEQTGRIFEIIEEMVSKLNKILLNTDWKTICSITDDFEVLEPEIYD